MLEGMPLLVAVEFVNWKAMTALLPRKGGLTRPDPVGGLARQSHRFPVRLPR